MPGIARALELLAAVEIAEGHPDRGLRLAGAAAALAASLGAPEAAYLHAQKQAEPYLKQALEQVAATSAALWAAGESMPLDEAVSFASGERVRSVLQAPSQPAASLTRRERDVAELIALGLTNREIGLRLFISEWTAKRHVENILRKLDLGSRAQVA